MLWFDGKSISNVLILITLFEDFGTKDAWTYYIPGVIPAFVCPTQKYNPESSDVTLTIV